MIVAIAITAVAVVGFVIGLAGFYFHERAACMQDEHEKELFL